MRDNTIRSDHPALPGAPAARARARPPVQFDPTAMVEARLEAEQGLWSSRRVRAALAELSKRR